MATDTKEMIFKLNKNNSVSSSKGSTKKQYHEINVSRFNDKIIVEIINISSRVIDEMDEQQAHNEVLNVINAGVSHELRNPLNAIQAQNIQKKKLYQKLRAIKIKDKKVKKAIDEILDELETGNSIQQSSSELMNSMIQDLLDYAQIKAGKFRKNFSIFNIREAIEQVVSIQRSKAHAKGLEMPVIYENIAESHVAYQKNFAIDGKQSPMIKSDQ